VIFAFQNVFKGSMSKQTEASIEFSNQNVSSLTMATKELAAKKLYSEQVQAELAELQSDIDILFQKLQSLSCQRLTTAGSIQ